MTSESGNKNSKIKVHCDFSSIFMHALCQKVIKKIEKSLLESRFRVTKSRVVLGSSYQV